MKGKITKLIATQDQQRVNIYLDGKYIFTVDKNLIIDYEIFIGKELDEDVYRELVIEDFKSKIFGKILNSLARRPHSKFEIRNYIYRTIFKNRKIIADKVASDEIDTDKISEEIINKLIDLKYLDDREFAKAFANSKVNNKSKLEIKQKLLEKGIDTEIINNVLGEVEIDETALLQKLISKKLRQLEYKKLSAKQKQEKIIQSLMRKGYRYGEIMEQLDTC